MQSNTKVNIRVVKKDGFKNITCNNGENLLSILINNNINILNYCNGNGTCGKCKVNFLDNNGRTEKSELACLCNLEKDCIIEIVEFDNNNFEILSDYSKAKLDNDRNLLKDLDKRKSFEYGVAIDIGTTTVVLSLVNLKDKKVYDTIAMLNPQRKYGADVITRIQYSLKHEFELTERIQEVLKDSIQKIIQTDNSLIGNIKLSNIVIAGNTTMLYLLRGLSCKDLAIYPFDVKEILFEQFDFNEIFKTNFIYSQVTLLPCISAFVGADIVSDILFTDMHKSDSICMLLDIGTNGEMVIGNKDRLLCTATAAGPVFEGANIKSGIGSVSGAINKVKINGNHISYDTIKNKEPMGICGSGVIDMVSELLINNLMDNTGLLDEELYADGIFTIYKNENDNSIVFTQKDIREVQLAKSAIRAGIEVLIQKFGTSYEKISKIYISGGFGTYINIDSSINIGMLPKEFAAKIEFIGNGSLGGAIKYLTNSVKPLELEVIRDKAQNINLAKEADFNNLFIKHMSFYK
jgi:uncharacterized 2Fe-2S/4Fe-4S cluster protein (DUF4445 family)